MSVTAAKGFTAAGIAAGIKDSGNPDLALVVNNGPRRAAAGVFTSNRVKAAPVLWSEQVLKGGEVTAVVLNSGGANACTGPQGFQDTHATAEKAAEVLAGHSAGEIAVASTGLIGLLLPMDKLLPGIEKAAAALSEHGGEKAAIAIKTTDTVHKTAVAGGDGWTVGGMAKGAGMLAPGLATMLVVLTTDADVDGARARRGAARRDPHHLRPGRLRRLHVDQRHRAAARLGRERNRPRRRPSSPRPSRPSAPTSPASSSATPRAPPRTSGSRWSTRRPRTTPSRSAASIARNNLLKCAIHGEDPNWGRVLSAIGTTKAAFEPDRLNVAINDVWVCKNGGVGEDRDLVDMRYREVRITADLAAGDESAVIWANDLTAEYVHENSAYSS